MMHSLSVVACVLKPQVSTLRVSTTASCMYMYTREVDHLLLLCTALFNTNPSACLSAHADCTNNLHARILVAHGIRRRSPSAALHMIFYRDAFIADHLS
jgi:hypothetical protein